MVLSSLKAKEAPNDVDQFRFLMDGADTIGLSQACMAGDRVDFITGPLANSVIKSEIVSIDKRKRPPCGG